MSTFRDWKVVNKLSDRGQTNSEVHLLQKKDSDEFIVRKVIHGIDHPLYQAIFTREMRALYKLNKSENIVSIVGDDYLKETKTGEKVGVIYLEYIKKMQEMGITIFSFAESILDIKLFGPRVVGNYVDDFLLKFLKEIRILQKEIPFTFHLCPKSSLILVDLNKADFFPIEYEIPKKYIDILYENKCFLGDRCLNLADKKFKSVNKIILKEE